jgi:hypothetical protein
MIWQSGVVRLNEKHGSLDEWKVGGVKVTDSEEVNA